MNIHVIFFQLLPAFCTALAISLLAMPAIIQVASLKNLMDEPDEDRKRHEGIVPTLGGIGIFSALMIAFSIWGQASSLSSYPFFVASLFMLFLIGIKDDILIISPIKKLAVQIFAAIEIVIGGNVVITNFGGVFGIYQVSNFYGSILTIALFVLLINAYNLIDGIDGLASGVGILISSVLGYWFMLSGFITLSILAATLVGALVGFLIYNFHPAKIFMGDTGAMAVGFIIVFLIVKFISLDQANPGAYFYLANAPVFALALFILPVVDTLRVIVLRLKSGNNPMVADFNHMHHYFIKAGMKPDLASYYLWIWNGWIIFLAYYFDYMQPNTLMIFVLVAGFSIIPVTKFIQITLTKISPQSSTVLFPQSNKQKY